MVNATSLPLALQHYPSALESGGGFVDNSSSSGLLDDGGVNAAKLSLPPAHQATTAVALSTTNARSEKAVSDIHHITPTPDEGSRRVGGGEEVEGSIPCDRRAGAGRHGFGAGETASLGETGVAGAAGPLPRPRNKLLSQPPFLGLKQLLENDELEPETDCFARSGMGEEKSCYCSEEGEDEDGEKAAAAAAGEGEGEERGALPATEDEDSVRYGRGDWCLRCC